MGREARPSSSCNNNPAPRSKSIKTCLLAFLARSSSQVTNPWSFMSDVSFLMGVSHLSFVLFFPISYGCFIHRRCCSCGGHWRKAGQRHHEERYIYARPPALPVACLYWSYFENKCRFLLSLSCSCLSCVRPSLACTARMLVTVAAAPCVCVLCISRACVKNMSSPLWH